MKWPSLSIAIPTYNQEKYIERTILSILKQNYQGNLEVIVADGGSSDNTVSILKKYPQILWWSRPDNGPTDALIKAFKIAKGEILANISSDDFYLRGAFQETIPYLVNHPEIGFVAGSLIALAENQKSFTLLNSFRGKILSPLPFIIDNRAVFLQCAFIRKYAFEKIMGYRIEASQCSDIDLLYRMLHFFNGIVIPRYISVFQIRKEQQTQINASKWIKAFRSVIEDCQNQEEYSNRFSLPSSIKKEIDLKKQIFWNYYAGGKTGKEEAKLIIRKILSNKKLYPKTLSRYARAKYILLILNQSLIGKIIASVVEGTILEKVKVLFVSIAARIYIDINWWRK